MKPGNYRRTKIVATLGPATQSDKMIRQLVRAGVNVFRLNFSHGDHASHLETIRTIQKIREEESVPVAILQDLSGPKIRVGAIDGDGMDLKAGDELVLDAARTEPGRDNVVGVNYSGFARDVYPGARLLLADGDLELRVERIEGSRVICEIVRGGKLSSHKGVNFPSGSFNIPALTEKDVRDLEFGLEHGIDMVAMSFVRSDADLEDAHRVFQRKGRTVPLIAKIEKHEALENLDAIIERADGIMVARGDLGVEVEVERVPVLQKEIIRKSNLHAKPVITATQMLRSMVESPYPTRAEVTDVANAILDGSDAVMLSEETAVGKYPVKAVEMMARVARQVESIYPFLRSKLQRAARENLDPTDSVAHSAVVLAEDIHSPLIICVTRSGYTARKISHLRPRSLIFALTPDDEVFFQLALLWGVIPAKYPLEHDLNKLMSDAVHMAKRKQLIRKGEAYVLTSGFPLGAPGSINQITGDVVR